MGRLIDADKLKEHYSWWEGGSQEMTLDEAKRTFDTIVDLQPSVDAVPVRHGRWLDVLVADDDGETDGVECSECGYTDENVYWAKTYHRFCPNCGAKMDEEEE